MPPGCDDGNTGLCNRIETAAAAAAAAAGAASAQDQPHAEEDLIRGYATR
jgi:hypothetical protein